MTNSIGDIANQLHFGSARMAYLDSDTHHGGIRKAIKAAGVYDLPCGREDRKQNKAAAVEAAMKGYPNRIYSDHDKMLAWAVTDAALAWIFRGLCQTCGHAESVHLNLPCDHEFIPPTQ